MDPATTIILFAHGSSVAEANRQVAELAAEVGRRAGCQAACAFLDVTPPDLAAAVADAARNGARRVVVLPYFLTMGVHAKEDLPRLVAAQRARFPQLQILLGPSLESYPGMADVLLDRFRAALAGKETS